jgi:dihydropteroate synthase
MLDHPPTASRARRFAVSSYGRVLVMGVVNVTPDSFSDGGQFLEAPRAISQARRLATEGADILDIGAESSRPYAGMQPVLLEEELARLAPILPAVVALARPVSIDTMKAKVAAWALEEGAVIVNDVWGLQRDPDMARVVAEHGATVVVTHNRETADPSLDIFAEVKAFFARSLEVAARAGVADNQIVLDPGIGFGKTPEQNLQLIDKLDRIVTEFGLPVLLGTSRKSFIKHALDNSLSGIDRDDMRERVAGTAATVAIGVLRGARIVRVHDVGLMVAVTRMTESALGERRAEN